MKHNLPGDHRLFDGHYLAFPGSWLGRRRGTQSDDERRAGDAIRAAFLYRYEREGGEPIALMLEVEAKALAQIEKHGAAAYADKVFSVTSKKEAA